MKFSIIIILSFFAGTLRAQKISTTASGFSYKIKKEIIIPKGVITYNNALNTSDVIPEKEKLNLNKSRLKFPSGTYTFIEQNPDMVVSLEAPNFKIINIAEDIPKLKQSDPVLYFSYKPLLFIKDKGGKIIHRKILIDTTKNYLMKGDFFFMPTIKVLFGLYKNSPQEIKNTLMENEKYIGLVLLNSSIEKASNFLSKGLNDQVIEYTGVLCSGKKGFDYAELDKAVTESNNAIFGLTAFGAKNKKTPDQVGSIMKNYIPLWEMSLLEQDTLKEDSRINKEIAKGIKLNLATAYFFNKDYNKALFYLDEIPESIKKNGEMVLSTSFKGSAQALRSVINDFILFKEYIEVYNF